MRDLLHELPKLSQVWSTSWADFQGESLPGPGAPTAVSLSVSSFISFKWASTDDDSIIFMRKNLFLTSSLLASVSRLSDFSSLPRIVTRGDKIELTVEEQTAE